MLHFIKKNSIVIIIFITLLSLVGYMKPGMPVTDDGQDHVARIATFYASLKEGNLIPRWGANLNWGYGHPVVMFLYPLSSYLGSLFHFLGMSFVDSTKLVFIIAGLASVLTIYVWMKTAFGMRAAVLGTILYTFAPYRFVDLYVRGAIGEHMAFVFPPLVLYFLYQFYKKHTVISGIGISISFACLVLAHNAISLMFLPIILLYSIYLYLSQSKRKLALLIYSFIYIGIGFGLAAFFWMPALLEGKFTLRDIVTKGEALKRFVPFTMFLYSPWGYGGGNDTTKFLGFAQWVGIVVSVVSIFIFKVKRTVLAVLLFLLACSLFIMTSSSSFIWKQVMILQNFQFPWRFLSISVFLAAVLGALAIDAFLEKIRNKNAQIICLTVFCLFTVFCTVQMWKPRGYAVKPESFYAGVYPGTTDTGESSPIWSVRFMEHTALHPMEVIAGEVTIQELSRSTTIHIYRVSVTKQSILLENTLFFPGWRIYVDGVQTEVQFQDPTYRGLMTFQVDKGEHEIQVIFGTTKIRTYAEYISIGSIVLLIFLWGASLIWKQKK
jgi:uncharacterized membrane protein